VELGDGTLVRRWNGHQGWVSDVAFSPDGSLILSGSADGTLILWERKRGNNPVIRGDRERRAESRVCSSARPGGRAHGSSGF